MDTIDEVNHAVLQKLIMIFLGFLFLGVVLQSCTYHQPCSAYSKISVEEMDAQVDVPTLE
ncbi:MAG: hypothetical protein ACI84C_002739 [Flavobacteriales bacterium]|jgi:hypothetical protein